MTAPFDTSRTRRLTAAAARNNALWCQAVCRSHRIPGEFGPGGWTSPRRTPPWYPDAVTTEPDADAATLLARVDASPGCTVKDSFAVLDLADEGFRVLFGAEWIHRPADRPLPPRPPGAAWHRVTSAEELAVWERAAVGADGPRGLFRPELLADPTVRVVAGPGCGAVLNRSDDVVGVSNVFGAAAEAPGTPPAAVWAGAVHASDALFPGLPMVGYESGPDLGHAVAAGFETVGPLRVWGRPEPSADSPVELETAPPLGDEEMNGLFAAAWPDHRPTSFQGLLARSLTWVAARREGRLVGFVNVAWDGGDHAFLLDTTVHPDVRRRGVGTRLVRRAAEAAREAGAGWLHVDYEPHLDGFYRGAGFRPTAAGLLRLDGEEDG